MSTCTLLLTICIVALGLNGQSTFASLIPAGSDPHSESVQQLQDMHNWLLDVHNKTTWDTTDLDEHERTSHSTASLEAVTSKGMDAKKGQHGTTAVQLHRTLARRHKLLRQLVKDGHTDTAFSFMSWDLGKKLHHLAEVYLPHNITSHLIETIDHTFARLVNYTNNTAVGLPEHSLAAFHLSTWGGKQDQPSAVGDHLYFDRQAPWLQMKSDRELSDLGYVPLRVASWRNVPNNTGDIAAPVVAESQVNAATLLKLQQVRTSDKEKHATSTKHVRRYPCVHSKYLDIQPGDHIPRHYIVDDQYHMFCAEYESHAMDAHQRTMYPQNSGFTFPVVNVNSNGLWNILVMPMDFPDLVGYPASSGAQDLQALYGSNGILDRFFMDISQGHLRMSATVTPLIRSTRTVGTFRAIPNALGDILSEALSQVSASGTTISSYNQFVVVTKAMGAPFLYKTVSFSGIAGCHSNGQDTSSLSTTFAEMGREFGRNMGLQDSQYRHLNGTIVSGGNTLSVMGNAAGNFNPHMVMHDKNLMGWVSDIHVIRVKRNSRTYRLMAHDSTDSYGHRALSLGYGYHARNFYIEYRQFNGFGTQSSIVFPSARSALTQPLVTGALVTYEPQGISGSVLLDGSPLSTPLDDPLNAPVAAGASYDIRVNGITTGNVYATVSVTGSGGSNEDAYIDVKVDFPATPYCPFSTSGAVLCERDLCNAGPVGSFTGVSSLDSSTYATDVIVQIGKQLAGISVLNFSLHSGMMSGIDVAIYSDSNRIPGTLIASQSLTQSSSSAFVFTSGSLYQLNSALGAGTYWIVYTVTPDAFSSPSYRFSSVATDNTYTQIRNSDGTWRSTYREIALSVTYSCEDVPVDPSQLVFYDVPQADIHRGYPFNVILQYRNAENLPQRLIADRTLSMTLTAVTGSGVLRMPVSSWIAYSYSPYVTIPKIVVSAPGQYTLTVTDGTLSVTSPTLNVVGPTPATSLEMSVPSGSANNSLPVLRVQQSPPVPISLIVRNAWGEIDTETSVNVTATTGTTGATLVQTTAASVAGVVTFDSLQLQNCISPSTVTVTFTLSVPNAPRVTQDYIVDATGLQSLKFGTQAQSLVYDGQGNEIKYMYPLVPRIANIRIIGLTACNTSYTGSGTVITASAALSTVTLQGTTIVSMTSGNADFAELDLSFGAIEDPTKLVFSSQRSDGSVALLTTPVDFIKVIGQYGLADTIPSSAAVVQGQPLTPFDIQVVRSDQTVDTDATTTIVASVPSPYTLSGNTVTSVNGVATFSDLRLTSCPVPSTIRITFTSQSGVRNSTMVTADLAVSTQPAFDLVVAVAPGLTQVHHSSFSASVKLVDSCGSDDVTTSGVPVVASAYGVSIVTVNTVNGVAAFNSNIALHSCTAEPIKFTVPSTNVTQAVAGKSVTTNAITVTPQPSYALAFPSTGSALTASQPTTAFRAKVPIVNIVVYLEDSCGSLMTGVSSGSVSCTASDGTLQNAPLTASINGGIATFSAVTFDDEPATQPTLTFRTTSGSGVPPIDLVSQSLTVIRHNSAMRFSSSGSLVTPTTQTVTLPFNEIISAIEIQIVDSANVLDTTATDLSIQVSPSAGQLGGTTTVLVANGLARFSDLIFTTCTNNEITLDFLASSNTPWPVRGSHLLANVNLQPVLVFDITAGLPPAASIVSGESFTAILHILDSCGKYDASSTTNLTLDISTNLGTLSSTSVGFTQGVAIFVGTLTSSTPGTATLVFHVSGTGNSAVIGKSYTAVVQVLPAPSSPTADANTAVPTTNGLASSDLQNVRTIEYEVGLTTGAAFDSNAFTNWILQSIFPPGSISSANIEITNVVSDASKGTSQVRFRFVFPPATVLNVILPSGIALPAGTRVDSANIVDASETLYVLLQWLFRQRTGNNNPGAIVPSSSDVSILQSCPVNACAAGGIAKRTLDRTQCTCTCSNYYYGSRCDTCPSADMDSTCLTCTNGGIAPQCSASSSNAASSSAISTSSAIGDWYKLILILVGSAMFFILFVLLIVWIRYRKRRRLISPHSFANSRTGSPAELKPDPSFSVVPR